MKFLLVKNIKRCGNHGSVYFQLKDIKFDIISSKFDEGSVNPSAYKNYKDYALDLAKNKANAVYEELKNSDKSPDIVIGADCIVEQNNRLFGKPKDENQAIEYLSL